MLNFREFIMENFKILTHPDMIKRGPERVYRFIEMIQEGSYFLTIHGQVKLDPKQTINGEKVEIKTLHSLMGLPRFSATFTGVTDLGKPIKVAYPKDFYKTSDFGGEDKGKRLAKESMHLKGLIKEINAILKTEKKQFIQLKVGERIVECAGAVNVEGTPKADFAIVDVLGNQIAWISHKDGTRPQDFQQYGGLSDKVFSNNPEVKKFMTDLLKLYPKGLESGISVARKAQDKSVIMQSIYGTNYGGPRGPQNVDEFHQGFMKVVKNGKLYEIESVHKGVNGDSITSSGYEPIYFARYTTDRGANIAGIFVGKARIGVFPKGKTGTTTKQI